MRLFLISDQKIQPSNHRFHTAPLARLSCVHETPSVHLFSHTDIVVTRQTHSAKLSLLRPLILRLQRSGAVDGCNHGTEAQMLQIFLPVDK